MSCEIWTRCCWEYPEQGTEIKNTAKIPYGSWVFWYFLIFYHSAFHSASQERREKFLIDPIVFIIVRCNTSAISFITYVFLHARKPQKEAPKQTHQIHKADQSVRTNPPKKNDRQKYVSEHNFLHHYRGALKLRPLEYLKCQSGILFWERRNSHYSKVK